MKKLNSIWVVLLMGVTLWGCGDNSTGSTEVEASSQKQFVWNAMNYWYYWQGDVKDLADDRFSNDQAFQTYLKDFSDAEALFNSLLYQEDDFSFFIEDYEDFNQSQKGISKSFGFEFGLVCLENQCNSDSDRIFGYVQYVVTDSPADEAGLKRGDLFTSVDGTRLNVGNYRDLLLNQTSYELTLAEVQNNEISETDETVNLQAVTLTEDPIFVSKVIDTSSVKVGYLMYNAFQTNSHEDLNDVFGNFSSQGIDQLVLDLRYNGGGAGITSQMLAGMISGLDSSNVFSKYAYNDKRSNFDTSVSILEEVPIYNEQGDRESTASMNSLSLDKLYVLTGRGTASASEVLINGLKPYIDVVLIGRQTVGKDQGSYTLYDAPKPYLRKEQANPEHKIAIQPIILKVVNKNDQDYPDGFQPDYEVNELDALEDLPPLGDPNDPLLAKALELITGQQMARTTRMESARRFHGEMLIESREMKPRGNRGYQVQPAQVKNLNLKR